MTKQPKAKQRAMRGLLQPAQAILDTMRTGVTQTDTDGMILYANPAVAEMYGYEIGELVGCNLSLFHTSEQCWQPTTSIDRNVYSGGSERRSIDAGRRPLR